MISKMRPRRPLVSDDGPTTAIDFGQSMLEMSGIGSAQSKLARDDAAQNFGSAALNGELGRDGDRESELLFQRRAVADLGREKCGQFAYAMRQLLLPHRADILHDRALRDRLLARLQHAGAGHRHAPQGVQLRHEAAAPLRAANVRIWTDGA